jgi:nucleoside-diphosphate-sugar epimerase
MNILIIGGTRNIGYHLAQSLIDRGEHVTLLNRGISRDDLPTQVPRLRADRTDPQQLRRALHGRSFDVVIDMVMYRGEEAEVITELLRDSVGHYLFISTGQVYLVRDGIERPFKETDYAAPLMPPPPVNTYDYEEYLYGYEKSQAEDFLAAAFRSHGFPYTSIRIPMVNGERDSFQRLYSYYLRIKDGGPILAPDTPNHGLRHIYARDVVEAVHRIIDRKDQTTGKAYNISQDETLSLESFLDILAKTMGMEANVVRVERDVLQANGFLPDCSPFSERWMSNLDNSLSKREFDMQYTPVATYLQAIVNEYLKNPQPAPAGYRRRQAEKHLVTAT